MYELCNHITNQHLLLFLKYLNLINRENTLFGS